MANVFVGDNDHGDAVPPTDVLLQMIKTLRTERDEARRIVCGLIYDQASSPNTTKQSIAEAEGWDCFKEDSK
jgi:hypothetical protein